MEVPDLERHAILHDSADSLLIHAIGRLATDFQPELQLHAGICQMRGHFLQDTVHVPVDADGIKLGYHEEVVGLGRRRSNRSSSAAIAIAATIAVVPVELDLLLLGNKKPHKQACAIHGKSFSPFNSMGALWTRPQ